ncbi:MAG TPA: hypothetical protein VNO33_15835 [Kofleriaceae bacterium]|nr:hypothetical protein [Kofleriaceae bacterium]
MRAPVFLSILALCGAACSEELTEVSYVVNAPDPPVPVYELNILLLGVPDFPSTTSGTEPIQFPQGGSWGFSGDQRGVSIQVCAVGRGAEDELLTALSDMVQLRPEGKVGVTMTLALDEDGEVPPGCEGAVVDGGLLARAP